jgi:hypothetical protein
MWAVSLLVGWGCFLAFFCHGFFVPDFANSNPLADAFVDFGICNGLVSSCTQAYWCKPLIHDLRQTAFLLKIMVMGDDGQIGIGCP